MKNTESINVRVLKMCISPKHQALVYNSFTSLILSQGLLFVFATSSTTPLNTFSMIYTQQKQTQGPQDCAQN